MVVIGGIVMSVGVAGYAVIATSIEQGTCGRQSSKITEKDGIGSESWSECGDPTSFAIIGGIGVAILAGGVVIIAKESKRAASIKSK